MGGVLGQSVYLLENHNLQAQTWLGLVNSLLLFPHINPQCGHCESTANHRCHLSEGTEEKSDGEEGGEKHTALCHIMEEQNENTNTHTQESREEEMRW